MFYKVYCGSNPHNQEDYDFMAISADELTGDNKPADYFKPAQSNIEYEGDLEIDGSAAHYLPPYFSVK